ncbi:MAG TPA: STAS domain-containing protein [Caulobacteraceae bacterium]|nr:STAS domain-containing protein [Caulobacteraceae bacterium]
MDPAAVQLSPVLDLTAAAALAAELLPYRGRPLSIDASQVQRLGGQCLQVLLSAEHTWQADGAAFAIADPSDRFLADWRLFGAPDFTADPSPVATEFQP